MIDGTRPNTTQDKPRDRFINHLYRRHAELDTDIRAARAELAQLRRGLDDGRQQTRAFGIVLGHNPPENEEQVWLLVAVLFAWNPQPRLATAIRRRSLGAAMARFAGENNRPAVDRRFGQLVSTQGEALKYQMRQTIRLLGAGGVHVDFHLLLDHLATLLSPRCDHDAERHRQRVRLKWTTDYYRPT